ncbi:NF-kappa-B inhibitor-interacting Ras-like protein [Homalodisca vitripennis]|nr:NF-kappa-B inhibitor-interacting Ras-like protein [Homalodisca vitripennis]KAG8281790.1 NF-kappa-B inhibitor-interacting Ras-like protein 1 [Homalodisca vitripennis]
MGKTTRVIVCGMKSVGKTAILEQAIYGNYNKDSFLQATIEDIYVACVETERGTREKVRFYDTAGLESVTQARQVSQAWQADGYVLVYDTSRPESFDLLVQLKKEIDKNKEKKEVVFIILGHNIKTVECPVPLESPASKASHWSIREKIRHFEVNALDRTTLFEPFVHLSSKLNQPPNKSGFHQLSMVRKSVKLDS